MFLIKNTPLITQLSKVRNLFDIHLYTVKHNCQQEMEVYFLKEPFPLIWLTLFCLFNVSIQVVRTVG